MNPKLLRFIDRYWVLLLIIAIKFILQYVVVNPVYELHRDEFLHLDQANHLAFGFISVPPFTSLVSKIILLLGGDIFWVRFFPALFGALTIIFVWLIAESLGGSLYSKILASSALLFSLLVRINILFQPNSFDILIWTIIFYLLVKYVQSEKSKWLFLLSIIVALGFYNKYNLAFLIIGLLASLLLTSQRKIFSNISFWKAALLAAILILPNIIWQIVNHFPVIEHMKVLKSTQLENNSASGFLRSQVMYFFGSLPLTLGALFAFAFFKPFKQFRFIGLSFILGMALFTILKAKDYYAIGLFPVLFAFGSVYFERVLSSKWKPVIVTLLICFNLSVSISTAKLVLPLLSPTEIRQNSQTFEKLGLLRWEDGKNHSLPQDFADMIGWREMADISLKAYKMIPADELESTMIFCDNYGQTGALNYYNRGKMPEAYSFATDYIYWLPRMKKIQNILIVGDPPRKEVTDLFKETRLIGTVENEYAREKGTSVYLMTGANSFVTDLFYKLAEDRKKKFDIF
jgi:hypothetical protein